MFVNAKMSGNKLFGFPQSFQDPYEALSQDFKLLIQKNILTYLSLEVMTAIGYNKNW